jgi:hypothetical protein
LDAIYGREVGSVADPGSGAFSIPASGMEKIRIRDKHPGSATLSQQQYKEAISSSDTSNCRTQATAGHKQLQDTSNSRNFILGANSITAGQTRAAKTTAMSWTKIGEVAPAIAELSARVETS